MQMFESVQALPDQTLRFELPKRLLAEQPAEVRGSGRDDVRLLVTGPHADPVHAHFRQLPDFMVTGDLIVLNRSATMPAALRARREDGSLVGVHLSTHLPADLYVLEPREGRVAQYELLRLPGGAHAELLTPYRDSARLWVARLYLPKPLLSYLGSHGQPITYRHITAGWPLETFQNVYASEPGSAEMPSAGRPFTWGLLERLRRAGVEIAYVTLHAGVSTPERGEPPYEEAYSVPAETAEAVRRARRHGRRVIAVGTTVVRALESSLDAHARVIASRGWTDLFITPERGVASVDGVLTGFHEPESSHLAMLEGIAGSATVRRAYATALSSGYLWHEFGDSNLILR